MMFWQICLVEGASGDLIPKMQELFGIKTFDFVFLDHWKDRYLPDIKLLEVKKQLYMSAITLYMYRITLHENEQQPILPFFLCIFRQECQLLRKGSILLADNVICPGTPDYLEYVRNSPRYESKYFKSHLEYTKVEDGLEKSVFLG